MRNPNRIPIILEEIRKLWEKNPDQRFGQLLENYVFPPVQTRAGGMTAYTFFQDDDETLDILKKRNK